MDDALALSAFCREVYPRLVGALSLHCGDHALAEQVADEAVARVCRDWNRVRSSENPAGWAYRCAINLANSHFRRLAAERRARARLAHTADAYEPDVATVVTVRRLVAALPRREKTALILRYYLDLSVRETADLMGCPEGTVKTLTRRANQALRRELEPERESEVRSGS